MSWGNPRALLALPVILLLLTLVQLLRRKRQQTLRAAFGPRALSGMTHLQAAPLHRLRATLQVLGILFCTLAVARPQWGYTWVDVQRRGLEIVVLLDTSNSMRANDLTPSRLQRAKWGIEELVGTLRSDRIGLVALAGDAQVLCPLTLDYGAFMLHLNDVFPGIIPRGGTKLPRALEVAAEAFDAEEGEADRVMLLISDGETHEGDVDAAARMLRDRGIRVFAIGIGTPEGSLIPLPMDEGGPYLRNRQGEVVMSALDEATLLRLTRTTNGLYHRATPADFGVTRLIEQGFAPLQRAQLETSRIRQMREHFILPLSLGILLLFLDGFARLPSLLVRRRSAA